MSQSELMKILIGHSNTQSHGIVEVLKYLNFFPQRSQFVPPFQKIKLIAPIAVVPGFLKNFSFTKIQKSDILIYLNQFLPPEKPLRKWNIARREELKKIAHPESLQ
jgi:hypothetical protein